MSYQLFKTSHNVHQDNCTKSDNISPTSSPAKVSGLMLVCAVSLLTAGLLQTASSLLLLLVHLLHGYSPKPEGLLVELVRSVVEVAACLVAAISASLLVSTSLKPESVDFICNNTGALVYGLPGVIVVLGIGLVLHLVLGALLLLTVGRVHVLKDSPVVGSSLREPTCRSPAIYIDRAQLKELNNSADLLRLHNVLRTRLPSLRSNLSTQPSSPGFLGCLDDLPLTPYLNQHGITLTLEENSKTPQTILVDNSSLHEATHFNQRSSDTNNNSNER